METVEHDGRQTAYRLADRGAGERTILFVHGSGGDRRVWKSQDRLASTHRVVAVDLAGHGDSDDVDTEPGPATLDAYAADVAAVAGETDTDVLVGNSLGGAVVQWAMLEEVVEPEAAVLVGSGAKLAVMEQLRDWLRDDYDRAVDFLHEPGRLFADADERLVAASRAAMYDCGQAVTSRDYRSCHTFDVRNRLGEIDVPVLAIGGTRDGLTPPAYHAYLARQLPAGVLALIDGAGHLVMLESPERFNHCLRAFLHHVD